MSLRRMVEGGGFDPKSIVLLLEVFDEIVVDLDLRTDADREKAAKMIIRLAHGQPNLDAAKIRADVVRLMRKRGAGRPVGLAGMVKIPITEEAYEALKANTPGVDQAPTSKGPDGQVEIWLDRAVVDRLRALREPGEGYSDVIRRRTKPSKEGIPRPIMIWPRL
jgi:hypothetical protein